MTEFANLSQFERWDGVCPGDHQNSSLDNFNFNPNDQAHNYFRRVADKLVNDWEGNLFAGVMIHGTTGTGKTHAAVGLARALHNNGADVVYRFVPELQPYDTEVAKWTAPRVYGPAYSYDRNTITKTVTSSKQVEGRDITISETSTGLAANASAKPIERDPNSVFPSYYADGIERNPKTVLILDDFKPLWRTHVRSAIEAASNFGGLVIMTSNFGDVFQLDEPSSSELSRTGVEFAWDDSDEVRGVKSAMINAEAEILKNAFASRLMAGFVEINFREEVDHRQELSFWTDMLSPDDFQ